MTVTAFLYVLISSFTDNLADVMRKSIAGMENVCGIRANTLKNMAKAISQNVHLVNRRFDFDFGSFASCAFANAFDALLLLIRTVFHHQIPHTNLHQLHRVPLLTCAPYVTPILEDNKKENNGYSPQ